MGIIYQSVSWFWNITQTVALHLYFSIFMKKKTPYGAKCINPFSNSPMNSSIHPSIQYHSKSMCCRHWLSTRETFAFHNNLVSRADISGIHLFFSLFSRIMYKFVVHISFSCLTALARTSIMILQRRGERECPFLIPDQIGRCTSFLCVKKDKV